MLTYRIENMEAPNGYTNSDYARNQDNRKSTSRYVFMHISGVIYLRSKLLDYTTLLTMEAEYIVASEVVKEAIVDSLKKPLPKKNASRYGVTTELTDNIGDMDEVPRGNHTDIYRRGTQAKARS